MLGRVFFRLLISGAIAGSAVAQTAGSDYELLSAGNRHIADALYSSQQPIEGTPTLTRDDIASLHSEGGWGVVFQDLKDSGYYPDAKNLGQVVSNAHRPTRQLDTSETSDTGRHHRGTSPGHHGQDAADATAKHHRAERKAARHAVRHHRVRHATRVRKTVKVHRHK